MGNVQRFDSLSVGVGTVLVYRSGASSGRIVGGCDRSCGSDGEETDARSLIGLSRKGDRKGTVPPSIPARRINDETADFGRCFLVQPQRKAPVLGNHSQNSTKLQSAPVLYSRGWFFQGHITFPKWFHSCHYRQNDFGRESRFDTPTETSPAVSLSEGVLL